MELHSWWLLIPVEVVLAILGCRHSRRGSTSGAALLAVTGYLAFAPIALTGMLFVLTGVDEGLTARGAAFLGGGLLACAPVLVLPSCVQWSRRKRVGWGSVVLGIGLLASSWVGGYAIWLLHLVVTYPLANSR